MPEHSKNIGARNTILSADQLLIPSTTYLPLPSPASEWAKGEGRSLLALSEHSRMSGDATVLSPINPARHARRRGPAARGSAPFRLLRRGLTGAAGRGLLAVSGRGASRIRNSAPPGGRTRRYHQRAAAMSVFVKWSPVKSNAARLDLAQA
jgi:hypothetical protein